jgi:hypothetical protein
MKPPHVRLGLFTAALWVCLVGCAAPTNQPRPQPASSRPLGQQLGQGVLTGMKYALGVPFVTAMVLVSPLVGANPLEMASLYRQLDEDTPWYRKRQRVPPSDRVADPSDPVPRA